MKNSFFLIVGLSLMLSCSNDDDAQAVEPVLTFDYNELLQGDLSNDFSAPTALTFVNGKNFISAEQASGDVDYFTFTVPQDYVLSNLKVDDYQSNDSAGFIGIINSDAFTANAGSTQASDLLGGALYGQSVVGDNILPLMGTLAGAQGFSGVLPAGDYAIWLNQTGDDSEASFTFEISKGN